MITDEMIGNVIKRFYDECDYSDDIYDASVKMAYRDTQRILHRIGSEENKKNEALKEVTERLRSYVGGEELKETEESFDELHKELCRKWTGKFDGDLGTYGIAQKIVNMSFKYLYTYFYYNDEREKLIKFDHCHFTIDSYTLRWLMCCGVPEKPKFLKSDLSWSKLSFDDYESICKYARKCVETIFQKSTPLQAEYVVWEQVKLYDMLGDWASVERKCSDDPFLDELRKEYKKDDSIKLNNFMDICIAKIRSVQ